MSARHAVAILGDGISNAWASWSSATLHSGLLGNNSLEALASGTSTVNVNESSVVLNLAWVSGTVSITVLGSGVIWAVLASSNSILSIHVHLSRIAGYLDAHSSLVVDNVSEITSCAHTLLVKVLVLCASSCYASVSVLSGWVWNLTGLAWDTSSISGKELIGGITSIG